jgi:hypothetical protein
MLSPQLIEQAEYTPTSYDRIHVANVTLACRRSRSAAFTRTTGHGLSFSLASALLSQRNRCKSASVISQRVPMRMPCNRPFSQIAPDGLLVPVQPPRNFLGRKVMVSRVALRCPNPDAGLLK